MQPLNSVLNFTPELLTNKSRLQEIYDLRVTAYENSLKSIYVNRQQFPNGLSDHLDESENTLHWIIEDNNKIIAAARLAIINDLADIKDLDEALDKYPIPEDRPFAYYSRLVVHPDYRKAGLVKALDNIRIEYLKKHKEIKFAIAWATQDRHEALNAYGFKPFGEFNYSWGGILESSAGIFLLLLSESSIKVPQPVLLKDSSRLQEIYDLRVLAWEKSQVKNVITRKDFPNGWFDSLDALAYHFVIEANNKIIAAARVNIINDENDLNDFYAFRKFNLPMERPFGFYSRLVVNPDSRRKGIALSLDIARINFLKTKVSFILASCHEERLESLQKLGFIVLGETELLYNKNATPDKQIAIIHYLNS